METGGMGTESRSVQWTGKKADGMAGMTKDRLGGNDRQGITDKLCPAAYGAVR